MAIDKVVIVEVDMWVCSATAEGRCGAAAEAAAIPAQPAFGDLAVRQRPGLRAVMGERCHKLRMRPDGLRAAWQCRADDAWQAYMCLGGVHASVRSAMQQMQPEGTN